MNCTQSFWPLVLPEKDEQMLQYALCKVIKDKEIPESYLKLKKIKGLSFGTISCSRAVQDRHCAAVIVDASTKQNPMIQPLLTKCVSKITPILYLADLRKITLSIFGIPTSILGVEHGHLHDLTNEIFDIISRQYPSLKDIHKQQSKITLHSQRVDSVTTGQATGTRPGHDSMDQLSQTRTTTICQSQSNRVDSSLGEYSPLFRDQLQNISQTYSQDDTWYTVKQTNTYPQPTHPVTNSGDEQRTVSHTDYDHNPLNTLSTTYKIWSSSDTLCDNQSNVAVQLALQKTLTSNLTQTDSSTSPRSANPPRIILNEQSTVPTTNIFSLVKKSKKRKPNKKKRNKIRKIKEALSNSIKPRLHSDNRVEQVATTITGPAEITCLDEDVVPRDPPKTPQPISSENQLLHTKAPDSKLIAMITTATSNYMTVEETNEVYNQLESLLFTQADQGYPPGPAFEGRPSYINGYLRLWCKDGAAFNWLTKYVKEVNIPSGDKLIVRRECDIRRRIRCGVFLPETWHNLNKIRKLLRCQNPWAKIDQWIFHKKNRQKKGTFLIFSIPESLLQVILNHERRLCFLLGTVYVKFEECKRKFVTTPPLLKFRQNSQVIAQHVTNELQTVSSNFATVISGSKCNNAA